MVISKALKKPTKMFFLISEKTTPKKMQVSAEIKVIYFFDVNKLLRKWTVFEKWLCISMFTTCG